MFQQMAEDVTIYEQMATLTREQIIDAWMSDKLFLQGQVLRLQGIVRDLHALHLSSGDLFRSSATDVVLE